MVGERVVRAMQNGELYVFTHMEPKEWLEARHRRIIDAFDDCERWIAEGAGGGAGRRKMG